MPIAPIDRVRVAGELARALLGVAAAPFRAAAYLAGRGERERHATDDLDAPSAPTPPPEVRPRTDRPLRIFLSCAEASGELHAIGLVRALRAALEGADAPAPELVGLGGPRLAALGVRTLADPVSRAAMGFDGVLSSLPFYLDLLARSAAYFRETTPDLVVPVDSPALHVPLGRLARRTGAPVVHFVTPQYWGWAPWRVGGYRRAVDRALTILPFEPPWFERHGVTASHVGHPIRDALADVEPTRSEAGPLLLLPGSRESVVRRNLPWMVAAASRVRLELGELDVVCAHERGELRPLLEGLLTASAASGWVRVETGALHPALGRARAALSVSGTVLLDLVHHRLPAVVVYRLGSARQSWLYRHFLTTPFFASPNLLAGREVYPEFCFHGEGPFEAACAALTRCYKDESWRAECRDGLDEAARRLGPAGALERAAAWGLAAVPRAQS